jgi:hypothetical protein
MDVGEYADALWDLRAGDAIALSLAGLSGRTLNGASAWRRSSFAHQITWARPVGDGEL